MQNTTTTAAAAAAVAADVVELNPEHFPAEAAESTSTTTTTTSTTTTTTTTTTGTGTGTATSRSAVQPAAGDRPQNFSFASSYSTSRFGSSANRYTSYKPISSFTILNNNNNNNTNNNNNDEDDENDENDDDYLAASNLTAGKPNAIVRPIRRPEPPALPQPLHKHAAHPAAQEAGAGRAPRPQLAGGATAPPEQHFADELNRKLRYLRNKENQDVWTKSKNSSRNGSHQETLNKRPLFITTVPTGVFLPPAREAPLPPAILRQRIYAFSSHPVVYNYNYNYNSNCNSIFYNSNDINTNNNNNNNNHHHHHHHNTNRNSSHIPIATRGLPASGTAAAAAAAANGGNGLLAGRHAKGLAGGVHLTKQQFHQQIQQQRAKREAPEPYKNIMYDKRVVRGSNFASTQPMVDPATLDKTADFRRRMNLRKKNVCRNPRNVLGTPPPVAGRHHEVVQTEKYLEELVERPTEFTVDTQTDLFLERPPSPPYIPAKVGVDVGTEIADGELFHFDAEAQPLIDLLVDSCIEQTMLEVSHEEEIAALRKKQDEYVAQREAELAELRRLEAEEIRLQAEKERRVRQDEIAKELDDEMQKGVTAAKLLQGHIASLLPEVLENLEPVTDAIKKEQLMKTVCPWLSVEVAEEVGHIVDSREILTVIIQEIIKQRAEVYAGYKEDVPEEPKVDDEAMEDEHEGLDDCKTISCNCETDVTDDCPPRAAV